MYIHITTRFVCSFDTNISMRPGKPSYSANTKSHLIKPQLQKEFDEASEMRKVSVHD